VDDSKLGVESIAKYYDYKCESYERKYNIGYYTHIHTGLYDPEDFPFLYRRDVDFKTLGLELIKYLLFVGQENLTRYACKNFPIGNFKKILDVGCGHGGTCIYLAQNYNIKVVGITVSQKQVLQTTHFVRMAGLQHLIDVRLTNALESDFADAEFDGVIAIDSFCHIGDFKRLFSVLSRIMQQGGKLVISDYFVGMTNGNFEKRFDSYWVANISTMQQLLDAAHSNGFIIKNVSELTKSQIPFWRLSIAYTEILLNNEKTRSNQAERQRLAGSVDFHRNLVQAFLNGDIRYHSLVLEKRI